MQDFSNILSTYYYHKLINIATRERKQSSTLLDNIYTNIPDCYETGSSGVLRFLTQSDHYPIFTVRKNLLPSEQIKYITKRIHNQQNIALFRKHLKSSNWITLGIYQIKPISQLFTIFMDTIQQYFNVSFPLEKTKIRYKNSNPWITKELISDIKIRDALYKLKKMSPTPENNFFYKMYKNTNLSKQRKAERDYYHEQFEIHKNDLKNSWKIIKEMIGKVDHHKVKKTHNIPYK